MTVELVAVDRGQVQWKMSAAATQVQIFLRSQIEFVDFPPTNEWEAAEEAIGLYQDVIAEPVSQFYPMPGNFSSLAQVRLLDCFRLQMNTEAIGLQAQVVRDGITDLPPSYREVKPEVVAWVAMSKQQWQAAVDALEVVEVQTPETCLIRGMALEELGQTEEAIRQYSGCYVLNFGGPIEMTKESLRRSASLLASLKSEHRQPELQAQVKIYRDLFGKGSLWEGAPDWLIKLADGELVVMSELADDVEEPEKPKGTEAEKGAMEDKPAVAVTLPDLSERDWILAEELPGVYVFGKNGRDEQEPSKAGGVKKTEVGYEFDGTGGCVTQPGVDGTQAYWKIRVRLQAESLDGVIAEMKGGSGGIGLYLEKGKVIFNWAPAGEKVQRFELGAVKAGAMSSIAVTCSSKGGVVGRVNQVSKPIKFDLKGKARGLGLGKSLKLVVGDIHPLEASNTGWTESIPFKGKIVHFSFGFGKDQPELGAGEMISFDGRLVRLGPPPQPEK